MNIIVLRTWVKSLDYSHPRKRLMFATRNNIGFTMGNQVFMSIHDTTTKIGIYNIGAKGGLLTLLLPIAGH